MNVPLAPDARLRHLFDPQGVIVVGASSHPAKFGFAALHNILASGFAGKVFAVNRDGGEILGLPTATGVEISPCPLGPARTTSSLSASAASSSSARRPSAPVSR